MRKKIIKPKNTVETIAIKIAKSLLKYNKLLNQLEELGNRKKEK